MKILLTNDDGYQAKGLQTLVRVMKKFGEVTVVAPKKHQSGMSMAISIGLKPLAFKDLGVVDGVRWMYLDGTPASCAKFAMDEVFKDGKPDVVISGINHGLNSSTAMWYSGTIGAAREGALGGSPSIAVSLDNLSADADFTVVEQLFPAIFEKLMANIPEGRPIIYNVNFPNLPADKVRGVKIATQGSESWVNEFVPYDPELLEQYGLLFGSTAHDVPEPEDGEVYYMMAGDLVPSPLNDENTDNRVTEAGYVAITPHSLDNTDWEAVDRLSKLFD
ncbi:MAG: 5'/3'-nucleotidase SurE [Bacteroidales bacterium]|nr:5'/3'-nucleotidase SurE [Bacteroidales bacterium]